MALLFPLWWIYIIFIRLLHAVKAIHLAEGVSRTQLTDPTWNICHLTESSCPKQRLQLWLLKESFHPNTWPITKWPFITLTLPLESCQCLSEYSAIVLSVSSQDTLCSVSTLPWLCLPQEYTDEARCRLFLTEWEQTTADTQSTDWLTRLCYVQDCSCYHFDKKRILMCKIKKISKQVSTVHRTKFHWWR